MPLFLTESDVDDLLTMEETIDAVEEVFKEQGQGKVANTPRWRTTGRGGMLHIMAASVQKFGYIGYKAYTTFKSGGEFLFMLHDIETGRLLAVMEARRLGQLRTGAASGVATKYMARENATTLGMFGTGYQAQTQIEAICQVRDIQLAKIYGRDEERRKKFCSMMQDRLKVEMKPVKAPEDVVGDVDIITTMTTSQEPLFDGKLVEPGVHINAAGSNFIIKREIDDEAVRRSDILVADSKDQARIESGDLVFPINKGIICWEQVYELGQIVAGQIKGRSDEEAITLFASQGIAVEDVAAASVAYRKAKEQHRGVEIL